MSIGIGKLCLGTVQLGLKYGINNELDRQPTVDESSRILGSAYELGVNFFDTASVYGNAEDVLGSFCLKNPSVNVISKLRPLDTLVDCNVEKVVFEEIQKSLSRLNLKSLYGYMLHRADDMYKPVVLDALCHAKQAGLITKIGVSIYEPSDAVNVVNDARLDMIQIPYNVFDHRLDKTDFFEVAKSRNFEVHARSTFLQGLLLMQPDMIPEKLYAAKSIVREFQNLCKEYGFTSAEGAMLYVMANSGIDKVVFGVDTIEQLHANIEIACKLTKFDELNNILINKFVDVEKRIVVPSMW